MTGQAVQEQENPQKSGKVTKYDADKNIQQQTFLKYFEKEYPWICKALAILGTLVAVTIVGVFIWEIIFNPNIRNQIMTMLLSYLSGFLTHASLPAKSVNYNQ
jgi:hypothetical protein